jgi:hypothetical protein
MASFPTMEYEARQNPTMARRWEDSIRQKARKGRSASPHPGTRPVTVV